MSEPQELTIDQSLLRAEKAVKQGNTVVAAKIYTDILLRQPNHPIAKKGLRKLQEELPQNPSLAADSANPPQDQITALVNLFHLKQFVELEEASRKLLQKYPESSIVISMLGTALGEQGNLKESIQTFDKAIQLKPDYAEAYSNRGAILKRLGRGAAAIKNYDKAIQLKPDYAKAYYNRGNALKDLRQLVEALKDFDKALQLKPDFAEVYNNRGVALKDLGRLDEAMAGFNKAIQLEPDYAEAYSNLLLTLNYLPDLNLSDHIATARKFGELVTAKAGPRFPDYHCQPTPEKLRVGLVSGDLRNHPIGYFLESVLSSIDPSTVELIAYPTAPTVDDLSERIKPFFSMWKPIYGQTDDAAANMIYADGVHVLLDLSGHTAGNRLLMFGHKPSPVQVSWLGYFATTGLNEMDYLIGDPYVTPPKDDEQFTEKIWRLPETRWCFTPPDIDMEVSVPPAVEHGYITFGCFNNTTKVNDNVVALWAKVLDAVPNSRLLLKARQLRDQMTRENIIQRFAVHGIDNKRISLEESEDRQKYFAAYNRIDITLDPFPFTGGTTSVESLWMGVPFVSLTGASLVSKQGVGVLMNAGLSDWVAADEEEYIAKAVLFAADVDSLASLRAGLRSQVLASPLFDAPRFARNIEQALWDMWKQWVPSSIPKELFPGNMRAKQGLAKLSQPKPDIVAEENPSDETLHQLIALYNKGQIRTVIEESDRLTREFPQSNILWNLLGAALNVQGKLEEAIAAYNKALLIKPDYVDAYNNMGVALKAQGKADEAIAAFNKALLIKPDYAEAHNNIGSALAGQDKSEEAIAAYNKALLIKPDYAEAHNNIGVAHKAQGKTDEAIAAYNKALLIKPDYAEAHNNMGNALAGQGKPEEAVAAFNKALLIKPDFADAHNNRGVALKAQGKVDEAIAAFNNALLTKPDYAEVHYNIGTTLAGQGKLEEAIVAYNKALLIKPDYAEAHNNIGVVLKAQGKADEAIGAYNKALLIKPDYADAHNNIGVAHKAQGKTDEAIAAYNKALLIKPDFADAHNNIGVALKAQGKAEEAIGAYNKALLIKPDFAAAHRNLGTLKKYTYSDPQVVQMEKLHAAIDVSDEDRCHLCFALAKSSEDLGNLEEAFRYLKEGNALRKRFLNYDIVQDKKIFYKIKESANSFKNFSSNVSGEENLPTPILILGMPRSGSTLVEQIISNHSKVTAGDELNFLTRFGLALAQGNTEVTSNKLRKVRDQYLDELMKLSAGQPFVTDKMPSNFFYIGLICSALPEAKIIHVKRNPASTCWSNYKQHFVGKEQGYSYDLLDVVHYYQMYEELMLYWEEQYPGKIYHLDYEQLTTDQESETKKLIQYLGVNWEDACLYPEENKRYVKTASNLQVRKKVYKGSSEQWKKFEKYLNKAFDGLPN